MSLFGIVVVSIFGANALLTYGLSQPAIFISGKASSSLPSIVMLIVVNAAATILMLLIRNYFLLPLGLSRLDIFIFSLVAVPALRAVSRFGKGLPGRVGLVAESANNLIPSSLVFGIVLLQTHTSLNFAQAIVGSMASGFGYWLAVKVLDSIGEQLAMSDIPAPFRGSPSILISAGLMSMAFMSIDTLLFRNLG